MEGRATLESVEAAFCQWRAQRSNSSEPIPEHLWVMALNLYPQYKRSAICQRLRLGGGKFKQRLELSGHVIANNGFVLASSDSDVVKEPLAQGFEVQLTLQGKERVLTLCVGVQELSQILPHIGKLL